MNEKPWFEQPWTCGHNDPIYRGSDGQECAVCGELRFDPDFYIPDTRFTGPAAGTWADVARMMAAGDDSGFDWDAWKDQMKDNS